MTDEEFEISIAMKRLDIYLAAFERADKPVAFLDRPYDAEREEPTMWWDG